MWLNVGDPTLLSAASFQIAQDASGTVDFSYPTPAVPQATITVGVSAFDPMTTSRVSVFKLGLATNAANIAVAVPAAPALLAPLSNATGVDVVTQQFRWSPFVGGMYRLSVYVGSGFLLNVQTADTSFALPDTTGLGLPAIASGTSLATLVTGYAAPSVDALLDPASNAWGSAGAALAPANGTDAATGVSVFAFMNAK